MTTRSTPLRRLVAVLALAGLALLLGTAPAWAHSRLTGSDPADGSSLDAGPTSVSLTFNETVQAGFSTVTVVGPDGGDYAAGALSEDGDTVTATVDPLGAAGVYQIGYRVVSADGHPIAGSVSFTLTTAGPGATAAAPSSAAAAAPTSSGTGSTQVDVVPTAAPTGDGGAPVWPWIVGAVVLVGGGAFAALRFGRQ